MVTKLSLINNAQAAYEQRLGVAKYFQQIAESLETDTIKLMETVSEVLAALTTQLQGGKPLTAMSPDSAAAFLSGIDFITKTLPNVKDKQNVDKILQVLNNVAMGPDGKITAGVASTIANLAHKNVDQWNQLKPLLAAYGQTPKANPQLSGVVGKLRIAVERAMTVASQAKPATAQPAAQPTQQQAAPQGTAAQAAPSQLNRPAPAKPTVTR